MVLSNWAISKGFEEGLKEETIFQRKADELTEGISFL